jgi:hypothetical protein
MGGTTSQLHRKWRTIQVSSRRFSGRLKIRSFIFSPESGGLVDPAAAGGRWHVQYESQCLLRLSKHRRKGERENKEESVR